MAINGKAKGLEEIVGNIVIKSCRFCNKFRIVLKKGGDTPPYKAAVAQAQVFWENLRN